MHLAHKSLISYMLELLIYYLFARDKLTSSKFLIDDNEIIYKKKNSHKKLCSFIIS